MRVVESAALSAPIALGIWRLTIAMARGFAAEFDAPRQEAMLCHELAHLAARDPAWSLVADLAMAALWWHPLAWLGVQGGFRSALGRRVERGEDARPEREEGRGDGDRERARDGEAKRDGEGRAVRERKGDGGGEGEGDKVRTRWWEPSPKEDK